MNDLAERKTLLAVGSDYRVLKDAPAFPNAYLKSGEFVHLEHVGYSPYDNAFGYTFRAADGSEKCFWLHDDEPVSLLSEIFSR